MNDSDKDLSCLSKKVEARQKFLEQVISFVQDIVQKHGKVLSRDVCKYHIRTVAQLKDFRGFSFYTDGAWTDFGGEEIKVWYNPGKKRTDSAPVLEVSWHEIERLEVNHFEKNRAWQTAIRKLIKDKENVRAIFRKDEEKKKRQEALAAQAAERRIKLQEAKENIVDEVRRLGL